MSVTLQTSSADTFDFLVEFETADRLLLSLGPCCGDDQSTPPQTEFAYTVVANRFGGFPGAGTAPLHTVITEQQCLLV